MSHSAIAAALARDDLTGGERLVAFSLASFADRRGVCWPGAPAGAARAGLSRSRYLQAREELVRRGLVVVLDPATGRGRSSTLSLTFALDGPWWDGDINAELFEAALSRSRTRGPARLLLAAMAALADSDGVVAGLTTEQLRAVAGIADRTYRRARATLLAAGELELLSGAGGRGLANRWRIVVPREAAAVPRRVPPPSDARPLIASVPSAPASAENSPILTGVSVNGGQDRTLSAQNRPALTGVSQPKRGQDRTLFAETPAQTPAETPAPNARAGREPQNPRTDHPPGPPEGGNRADSMLIEEVYVTERGRKRRRMVRVDLDEVRRRLGRPGVGDRNDWARIREALRDAVDETTYELWLERLELIAVDGDGALVLSAPAQTVSWLRARCWRVIASCANGVGRQLRLADEPEAKAMTTTNQKEASRW